MNNTPPPRELSIVAYGIPAPQGSKRHVGRGVMIESSKKVAPWRQTVKWAAIEAMHGSGMMLGPICIEIVFTLPKPKSAPKNRPTYPDRKPDIDKLLRSTFDALSEAGAWEDDARVVRCSALKTFPGEHPQALSVPGALISMVAGLSA